MSFCYSSLSTLIVSSSISDEELCYEIGVPIDSNFYFSNSSFILLFTSSLIESSLLFKDAVTFSTSLLSSLYSWPSFAFRRALSDSPSYWICSLVNSLWCSIKFVTSLNLWFFLELSSSILADNSCFKFRRATSIYSIYVFSFLALSSFAIVSCPPPACIMVFTIYSLSDILL